MKHSIGAREVVGEADARTGLDAGTDEIEMIIADAEVHPKIAQGREVVLQVDAGLSTLLAAAEGGEHIRVTTPIEKEAFRFPKSEQVKASLENMAMP